MKFSLNWLAQDLETEASVGEIAETLTMIGLEVESIEDRAKGMEDFVTARVLEAGPHPNADRLKLCRVDNGTEVLEVVCGAPNARDGLIGVFAGAGTYIPGIDATLKKSKIRGVTSNGMLLSEKEMGLSDDHEGIVELPADTPIGVPAVKIMGLGDPLFDIAITPNRGDCLGVRGIARDLAAAGIGTLKPLDIEPVPGSFESPVKVHLDFTPESASACPYFAGRMIRGVKNGQSPAWLREKLEAIGLRPISALVDITNLMTIALSRPLHVFDVGKLNGHIHVRLAREGETLLALDGKEYALDPEMTVIADEQHAEALGGVMGGEATGCTEETVDVFLESAYFDPVRTAATGRKLNLQSDARFRFERGVDPAFAVPGMELASKLILGICGGEASEPVIAGAEPEWKRDYDLRHGRVAELGGVEVDGEETVRILGDLGFTVKDGDGAWTVGVPSWRPDVVGEADLVEEVVRIHGYDKVPTVHLQRPTALPQPALDLAQHHRVLARRALAARGLTEAVTFSFLPAAEAEQFGGVEDALRLVNPISSDLDVMRPCLLPNLISAAARNADRGSPDLGLFEVGPQFADETPEGQAMVGAGLRAGAWAPRNWHILARGVDAFDAKGDALAVLGALGAPVASARLSSPAPAWYHPGRSGVLMLGPKTVLAQFGEIHPGIAASMGIEGPLAGFEIFLDNLPLPKSGKGAARANLDISPYQAVERDFAFVVDESVAAEAVLAAAGGVDKGLIEGVRLFDLFTGGNLGEAKKSLAIAVTLQPRDKTMTDAEIEAVSDKIVAAVIKKTGGVLRG